MIKKGQTKNLGPFSILIPDAKGYKTARGIWHVLESSGMTYNEAVENLRYNYPGWRIPNLNECKYIYDLFQLGLEGYGITGLESTYYWTSESINSKRMVFWPQKSKKASKIFFPLLGGNKIKVIYIKDSEI